MKPEIQFSWPPVPMAGGIALAFLAFVGQGLGAANDVTSYGKAGPTEAAAPPRHSYNEPYRPQFHFTYRRGWLSDPNGLVFYKGEYHLMTQHCLGTDCNYPATHWGHAVSTDLIHWQELPPALAPDKDGGMFSGSGIVDWNNASGLQSGKEKVLLLFYTGARSMLPDNRPMVICLAYSNDKGRTWTKYAKNPVVEPIAQHNRDPKVFWHEPAKKWIMVLALSTEATDWEFALLSSTNLKNWTQESRVQLDGACDCPDMFELPVDGDPKNTRWVFWAGRGYYQVDAFDGKTFKPEGPVRTANQPAGDRIPSPYRPGHQALNMSQIWSDIPPSDGRTIQIAWMHNGLNPYPGMPFNQQASFPCVLTLRQFSDGIKLCRQPVREVETLHATKHVRRNQTLEPGNNPLAGVPGELFDLRAELAPGEAKEVGFDLRGIPVTYDVGAGTLTCVGLGKPVALGLTAGKIKLQILMDRTSIEIFGNDGELSMAFCFLPDLAKRGIEVFARGGRAEIASLEVYEMKSIWNHPPAVAVPGSDLPGLTK